MTGRQIVSALLAFFACGFAVAAGFASEPEGTALLVRAIFLLIVAFWFRSRTIG